MTPADDRTRSAPPPTYAAVDDGPDTLLPLIQDATAGDYEILGELGRGGMAAVFLALDVSLNRKVAIKTMLPELTARREMVQRFKREAQMAAGLSHPHIVQIHSVKETKRLVYFVMKFIEGRSLDSIVTERGALPLDMARLVLQQAGSALSFAHHRGVVHRDVKPANIMIDENGWAVVTDFGIAKLDDGSNLTATGTTVGTPHYMAPEQFHAKPITGAADQYALGVVAYEMLTGKKPFDGGTLAEIITQHLFAPPPDIRADRPDLPGEVSSAIERMLAKEPEARFPDLDAAIAAVGQPSPGQLDQVRGQLTSLARSAPERKLRLSVPMSPVPSTRPSAATAIVDTGESLPSSAPVPRKRSRALWWAAAAVLVIALPGYFAANKFLSGAGGGRHPSLERGVQLWQQGQVDAARTEFTTAARERPTSALPLVYLARMAREGGDLDRARDEAVRAVQLEPENALALRELASVLFARGDYDGARRFFARTLAVSPDDKASMGWLACSHQRLGQAAEAARWAERADTGSWSSCLR